MFIRRFSFEKYTFYLVKFTRVFLIIYWNSNLGYFQNDPALHFFNFTEKRVTLELSTKKPYLEKSLIKWKIYVWLVKLVTVCFEDFLKFDFYKNFMTWITSIFRWYLFDGKSGGAELHGIEKLISYLLLLRWKEYLNVCVWLEKIFESSEFRYKVIEVN